VVATDFVNGNKSQQIDVMQSNPSNGGGHKVEIGVKMAKFKINPGAISERVIEADFFKLEGDYFWFFNNESEVVSINKAIHIDRIDRFM
jgi:hypothetical protein